MTEDFTIQRRLGWGVALTLSIECDPLAPYGVKLGLALRRAVLSGAVLSGAVLSGAVLSGADLSGAVLSGADLSGAVLRGQKVVRLIASANRLDGYTFYAFEMEAGGVMINAGCQFRTPASYREHVAQDYPGTDKAAETLSIIAFIEGRMADLGIEPKAEG